MDNAEHIWKALKKAGYNDYAVAGIMGNLQAESGLRPNNMQNAYEAKLGFNDDTYTCAVDNSTYHNFVGDHVGYGLAQWTYYTRKEALLDFCKECGKSIGDLQVQIDFLICELRGYTDVHNVLLNATSVREASDIVLMKYEAPADCSEKVQELRCRYGEEFYSRYADISIGYTESKDDIIALLETAINLIRGL